MKSFILAMLLAASPAFAGGPITRNQQPKVEFFTMDAMGCMLLQECTDGIEEVFSIHDIGDQYPNRDYNIVADEFHAMLVALNQVGVKVFLADQKYFPTMHRGVYHTVGNNFFLNKKYMDDPATLMMVMRHEGWHAAQDCMAGTINNSLIAIILPEDSVPPMYQEIVKATYKDQPHAIPWEKEAYWAGKTEGMTANALESCARGTMWTDYEPTPLTRKYLVEEGYLSK